MRQRFSRIHHFFALLSIFSLTFPPFLAASVTWNAAQGVRCEFKNQRARCVRAAWGFEFKFLSSVDIDAYPVIVTLRQKLNNIRPDQQLLVLHTRWINRTDRAMFLEPSSIWLRLEPKHPYRPMSLEELVGLWGDLNFMDTEAGHWVQKNLGVNTIYVPAKHYTEKLLLFRVPRLGWVRFELEVDPIWVGTEMNRFRLWGKAERNQKDKTEPPANPNR